MKQIATVRLAQAAARYSEQVPVATACCNACRTCVSTNAIGVLTGIVVAAAARLSRRAK